MFNGEWQTFLWKALPLWTQVQPSRAAHSALANGCGWSFESGDEKIAFVQSKNEQWKKKKSWRTKLFYLRLDCWGQRWQDRRHRSGHWAQRKWWSYRGDCRYECDGHFLCVCLFCVTVWHRRRHLDRWDGSLFLSRVSSEGYRCFRELLDRKCCCWCLDRERGFWCYLVSWWRGRLMCWFLRSRRMGKKKVFPLWGGSLIR